MLLFPMISKSLLLFLKYFWIKTLSNSLLVGISEISLL